VAIHRMGRPRFNIKIPIQRKPKVDSVLRNDVYGHMSQYLYVHTHTHTHTERERERETETETETERKRERERERDHVPAHAQRESFSRLQVRDVS